jgi:hypothetical protein
MAANWQRIRYGDEKTTLIGTAAARKRPDDELLAAGAKSLQRIAGMFYMPAIVRQNFALTCNPKVRTSP